MGMRFRRSITIVPGVRINLTTRGLSTTVGPRGASINIGPRGAHANLGLRGTGLSVRTRLDAPRSRGGARISYRAIQRDIREAERAEARRDASAAHEAQEHEFQRLRSILKTRTREPFDWLGAKSERPFSPQLFTPPSFPFTAKAISDAARQKRPLWPSLVGAGIAMLISIYGAPSLHTYALASLVAVLSGAVLWWTLGSRRRLGKALMARRRAEHSSTVAAARAEHAGAEDERRYENELRNAFARRLADAEAQAEPEALAELLEYELSHQDLPVPLVFELDFDGTQKVSLELALPELGAIPEERTELTKTGKLSRRKLAKRDRIALYAGVCASIVLRLTYETLRILPMVTRVEVSGTTEDLDPATGHPREYVALHLATERRSFEQLNLNDVDPEAALEGFGGVFAYTKAGELRPLAGVVGLRTE